MQENWGNISKKMDDQYPVRFRCHHMELPLMTVVFGMYVMLPNKFEEGLSANGNRFLWRSPFCSSVSSSSSSRLLLPLPALSSTNSLMYGLCIMPLCTPPRQTLCNPESAEARPWSMCAMSVLIRSIRELKNFSVRLRALLRLKSRS